MSTHKHQTLSLHLWHVKVSFTQWCDLCVYQCDVCWFVSLLCCSSFAFFCIPPFFPSFSHSFFTPVLISPPSLFFLSPCRSIAQGQIITISKPFARSLPANPMFGLMSHAPHLPRCGAAWDPFHKHQPGTMHQPVLWGHYTTGVGWWCVWRGGVPLG